jgi:hypothetical protein
MHIEDVGPPAVSAEGARNEDRQRVYPDTLNMDATPDMNVITRRLSCDATQRQPPRARIPSDVIQCAAAKVSLQIKVY